MVSTIKQDAIIFPCIKPDWPAPSFVRAYTTVRSGGFSRSPYDTFNLAKHVDDDPLAVSVNRAKLILALKLPSDPIWLEQIHSNKVVCAHEITAGVKADASYTDKANVVCAILTGDCLPLLITDQQGSKVAAIHAGWRGLAAGVIEAAIKKLRIPGNELLAWLGPTISAKHYEVGEEVRKAFVKQYPQAQEAFTATTKQKWRADLYLLARQYLNRLGINQIYGGEFCTYTDKDLFFSHRRDRGTTGRMATLIWKIPPTMPK
jgi:YfiH family protein